MLPNLIARFKRMRTEHYLRQTYTHSYAVVGMGHHALCNLYPVLRHLGVPLRYVCVTSERKARLITRKFPDIQATTSLDDIVNAPSVRGIFVSAAPSVHFALARRILQSGKSLFIEKPPCQSLEELDELIRLQQRHGSPVAMIGLQRRYAPAVRILRRRLQGERLLNYDLHFLVGAYPEGDALLDLFIHPLDLVTHLFGKADVIARHSIAKDSLLLMLRHPHIVGTLELSTAHSWSDAQDTLTVRTGSGTYRLSHAQALTFVPCAPSLFGLPLEKLHRTASRVKHLYAPNPSIPIPANNTLHTQGFYDEIAAFVRAVEGQRSHLLSPLPSLRDTYALLAQTKSAR